MMLSGIAHAVRLRRRLAALFVLAWLPLACGGDDRRAGAESDRDLPSEGGEAIVGVATGATTVLPPLARTALDYEVAAALYVGLNHSSWSDGGLQFAAPHELALASGWSYEADSTTLVYRLEARRWSDGRPLRAADVVFTYRLLADTLLALPLAYVTEKLDSVTARDDSTVAFHFRRRYPGMLFDTGVGVLPVHVFAAGEELEGVRALTEVEPTDVASSGPFRLDAWEPEDRIVLVRNPAAKQPPLLDRVVFRILPEETTRLAELRTGTLDVAQVTSFRQARQLAQDPAVGIVQIPQRAYDYIAWNPEAHPAFRDLAVREAFSLAIDRESLISALDMEGFAEPATGPYGSLFPELTLPPAAVSHDPERARELLTAAGWVDGDGDGVRESGDRQLAFTLATTAGNDRREAAVQIIQAQLAEVGVRTEIQLQELNSLFGRAIERDYEALLLGWQVGLDPDISAFWGDPAAPLNFVGYDSPEVRELMSAALAAASAEAAASAWKEAGARIAAGHPYAFLWHFDLVWAIGPRLRGVKGSVLGLTTGISDWWVTPEEGPSTR